MNFKIDWVLQNEIAVGPIPKTFRDIDELKNKKIIWIFSLCDIKEFPIDINYEDYFSCKRVILPDHKYKRPLTIDQLNLALDTLAEIIETGPVYIHCLAGVERSPLVCMAWLMQNHNLTLTQSLDYLMDIHKGTNPLPEQLRLLHLIKKR
tara:strand:+ start:33 stop:482 length:450 start_codon:yes stop_codon:yes gene_type:complete